MYRQLLKDFFKNNGVHDESIPSAQALMHFRLKTDSVPEVANFMHSITSEAIADSQPERLEDVAREKEEIVSANGYEQIVRMMRRGVDALNQEILIEKAMEFETDIIPDIVRRLKTNRVSEFIGTAVRVLNKSGINTAADLISYFDEIRSVYAQSLVLILLGFKAEASIIPWLIEQYDRMWDLYPEENYSDGAYYALVEMESRLLNETERAKF